MAYTSPLFSTTNRLGADLTTSGYNQAFTLSTATPEYPGVPVLPLHTVEDSMGGAAIYATTATATGITQGDVCYITTAGLAAGLTSALATTAGGQGILGVAMATLTTGQYGWFITKGVVPGGVNVVSSVAAGAKLHTSATAGRLTGTGVTGTSYPLDNIVTTATSGGTAGAYPGIINGAIIINTAATLG